MPGDLTKIALASRGFEDKASLVLLANLATTVYRPSQGYV